MGRRGDDGDSGTVGRERRDRDGDEGKGSGDGGTVTS